MTLFTLQCFRYRKLKCRQVTVVTSTERHCTSKLCYLIEPQFNPISIIRSKRPLNDGKHVISYIHIVGRDCVVSKVRWTIYIEHSLCLTGVVRCGDSPIWWCFDSYLQCVASGRCFINYLCINCASQVN